MSDKTILIVEDDAPFRERLGQALTKRGYATREAATVAEGVRIAREETPPLAVVDLRLEDGSGLDVVGALRAARPGARALILTGYGDIPTAVAAVRLGAVDYMAKPEGADAILDALLAPEGERPPAPEAPINPDDARQAHIEHVFQEAGENVSQAARLLNMHRRTLQRILKRTGLQTDAS